jgi:outer membrane protein assembly factor BamB
VSWEFPLPFQPSGTAPTPITADDLVVTSTMTNGTTAVRVTGGDKPAAARAWQGKDLHGYFSTGLAVRTDYLFLVTNTLQPTPQADLCCVDLKTGKVLWTQEKVGYFHFGAVRTGDDKLLILDDAGTLKLIDPDPKGYRELCRAKVCGGTLVTPVLSGGRVYARDDKEVVCLQLNP